MQENNLFTFFKTRLNRIGQRRWSCPDEAQIAAYADHQLASPAKDKVEAHLADCDFCLDQVGFLIRTANAPLPESVPNPLLIRARKLAGEKTRAEGSALWHWGRIAAAAACLVVVATITLRHQPEIPTTAPAKPKVVLSAQAPPQPALQSPRSTIPPPAVRGGRRTWLEPTLLFPHLRDRSA